MRYFFISYLGTTGSGQFVLNGPKHPSMKRIAEAAGRENDGAAVTILNIIELSEEDYKDFMGED